MNDKTTSIRNPAESADLTRIRRMLTNPYYCIRVAPIYCEEHDFIVTEEQFIKAGAQLIQREGAEVFIRNLLANLKGDYV